MTSYRRVLSAFIALFTILAMLASAQAVTPDDYDSSRPSELENDHLYAESAFLMDMDTGETLLSKNSRVRMYPASTTKIMTLLLALESDIALDEQVTIPLEAGSVPEGSSVIGIKPGDVMTWEDLLYAFMLKSGNDGSNAIAVLADGSIQNFVSRMNLRAMQLGCEGTHFVNAHGYHDQDHYTTAQDLARIANYAMQNETFRRIVAAPKKEVTITRGGQTASGYAENRNSLLLSESKYYYADANGIKTGHTSNAGWCVVASAERDGINLMAVVLNCATEERKWADAHKLLNYGFTQYASYTMEEILNRMQREICAVDIENAIETDPNGGAMLLQYGEITNGDRTRMIQLNSEAAMKHVTDGILETMNVRWNRELVAPVTAGEVLGTVSFEAPDGSLVTAELTASRDLEAQPEPTPSPTPTLAPPTGADLQAEGDTPEARSRNSSLRRTMIALLVIALLLIVGLAVYTQIRKERKRREAARRRAGRRRHSNEAARKKRSAQRLKK